MTAPLVNELPHVDEHAVMIDATAADVWSALLGTVDETFSRGPAAAYARAVGCDDTTASGPRPLASGSSVPGFRVASAEREHELTLVGRHRFSEYALTFRLDAVEPGCTRVRAETRALFPGVVGAAYRVLAVGSGAHVFGVRRMLSALQRRAEAERRTT